MDDTQRDGSDSDWDSTLDFTSPRQVGVGRIPLQSTNTNTDIDEESALSDESDADEQPSLAQDKPVINNVLKAQEDRNGTRTPVSMQKPNNVELAQKQQTLQHKDARRRDQAANQHAQRNDIQQGPPYNFKEAVNERITPEPANRNIPGKDRKGTTYDPAPSPTPRGITKKQGSIRSVGSWDESDADERTLRDVRNQYKQEKQREEQKQREAEEQRSMAEEAPHTARSETTWRSWAGNKFGKKSKSNQNSQASNAPGQSQAQQTRNKPQQAQVVNTTSRAPSRQEPISPPPIEIYDPAYDNPAQLRTPSLVREPLYALPNRGPSQFIAPSPARSPVPSLPTHQAVPVPMPVVASKQYQYMQEDAFEEPKRLFDKDDDRGRYLYYFGHGNLHYFEVHEDYDEAFLPPIADRVERIVQRVWREFFALLRIIFSIVIGFAVELFRFFAQNIFMPLILGIVVTLGDFFMKPLLSAVFNGFVQPTSIFFWNVFTGMRHMFQPLADILYRVLEQFAMLLRAIRLFEITWVGTTTTQPVHQV